MDCCRPRSVSGRESPGTPALESSQCWFEVLWILRSLLAQPATVLDEFASGTTCVYVSRTWYVVKLLSLLSFLAIREKFKLADSAVEQAEDILGQDVQVSLKFKGAAANSVRVLQAAIEASAQSIAAIPGFQNVFVDNKKGEVVRD